MWVLAEVSEWFAWALTAQSSAVQPSAGGQIFTHILCIDVLGEPGVGAGRGVKWLLPWPAEGMRDVCRDVIMHGREL